MVSIPRILIAGTHSGAGKTTVASGLMAALRRRGLSVQPFKVGPDYIDPGYHTEAAGRISRNLDTWLLKAPLIQGVFQHAAANAGLAVVEGVMGLFDGHSSLSERGSTAELAKWLRTPVILVVDGSRMARSAAAMVRGYLEFDPDVRIAGVIFNQVSEGHFRLLQESVRRDVCVPVLGYLPRDPLLAIPERHLGLIPAQERRDGLRRLARLAEVIGRTVDLDRLLRIARQAPPLSPAKAPWLQSRVRQPSVRIGWAWDDAFHFYYQENLDLLRARGAELIAFSPLRDARLPDRLDALYLGGGFPERFAEGLSQNRPLRGQVRQAVRGGLPTYAECGGLMYLAESLVDQRGRRHAMAGVLPGATRMTSSLQHFGYATIIPNRRTILAEAGDGIKGHEFHYSVWDHRPTPRHAAYTVVQDRRGRRLEGFAQGHLLASYLHVHFLTNRRWAEGLVASAQRFRSPVAAHHRARRGKRGV